MHKDSFGIVQDQNYCEREESLKFCKHTFFEWPDGIDVSNILRWRMRERRKHHKKCREVSRCSSRKLTDGRSYPVYHLCALVPFRWEMSWDSQT